MAAVMSEINEIQAVRDILADEWAPWARKAVVPQGFSPETIEYVCMKFGMRNPKGEGMQPSEHNPRAEEIEAVVVSMPKRLKRFILAEFIVRTEEGGKLTKLDKAKLTHTSKTQYYTELNHALWWLDGRV